MAKNNAVKEKTPKSKGGNKKVIAAVIIFLVIVGIVVYMSVTNFSFQKNSGEYSNLQTADDDFAVLDETLNSLEAAEPPNP